MSRLQSFPTRAPAIVKPATAWRIRFVSEAPAGAQVLRRFSDPLNAVAIAEPIPIADCAEPSAWPEPTDQLVVIHRPKGELSCGIGADWLAPPDHAQAPKGTSFEIEGGRLYWRPGRALVEGNVSSLESVLLALAEFAFYEGALRALEDELRPIEAGALADAPHAYVIRQRDKTHWLRFKTILENLIALRLSAVRLEPGLCTPTRALPSASRKIAARLIARADVENRLEAFHDRHEACEELYEGAIDRITDHGWARKGNLLEVAIVILLLLEVAQLMVDIWLHHMHAQ